MVFSSKASSASSATLSGDRQDATENTPLLVGGQLAPDGDTEASGMANGPGPTTSTTAAAASTSKPPSSEEAASVPLPKLQIFLLCYARVLEPIAFFSIFPFIAQMVQRNGNLPASDVGFYSGLIESLFSATQMVVLIMWGRLADRLGRKPMLIYSLVGTSICPALFGMSRNLGQMIFFRCLAGIFSGSSLIIRTMISENSTAETQARAFGWFAFAGNVGIFIGPLLGGALADPAEQYGWDLAFFRNYPYALPGFVTAAISLSGAVAISLFLKETLHRNKANPSDAAHADDDASPAERRQLSIWEILRYPKVGMVILNYNLFMLMGFCFTAIMPVALYTPVDIGGFGFGPAQISAYMATQGASQAIWLIIFFPPLHHRFGTKGTLRMCAIFYPFFFPGYIVLNLLLRDGTTPAKVWFWIIGVVVAFVGPGVSMAFTGVQLAINEVSPSSDVLGTLNAIVLTASSGIRAVAPGVATTIYAVGVRSGFAKGHLAWIVMTVLGAIPLLTVSALPDPAKKKTNDEEQEDAAAESNAS